MKTILIIGNAFDLRSWIKEFTTGKFKLISSSTPEVGIRKAASHHVDLVIFDTDGQEMLIGQFMDKVQEAHVVIPVVVISTLTKKKILDNNTATEVMGYIQKPFDKTQFLRSINKVFHAQKRLLKQEFSKEIIAENRIESKIVVSFCEDGIISKISNNGIILLLPTTMAPKTRFLLKAEALCHKLGLTKEYPEHLKLLVLECVPIANGRFKITTRFVDPLFKIFKEQLEDYLEKHAKRYINLSPTKKKTVLIAEDDGTLWKYYRFYLTGTDYRPVFAADGLEVLERLNDTQVDLLLLDMHMPQMGGKEVLEKIKKSKTRFPVIALTNDSRSEIVQEIASQVQDFLVKPVTAATLLTRIYKVFEQWTNKVNLEQTIGENATLQLHTPISITFQDSAVIKRVYRKSLLFFSERPFEPHTLIQIKATDFPKIIELGDEYKFELTVNDCERLDTSQGFYITAQFNDIPPTIQKKIDVFIDDNANQKQNESSLIPPPEGEKKATPLSNAAVDL